MNFNASSSQSYPGSYYADSLNYPHEFPVVEGKQEFETVVIGAGYAGIMTALGLVERGQTDIALIDKNKIGWGCSGRNGGFVFGGYSRSPRSLVKKLGQDKAKQLYQLTVQAVELIRHRIQQYQIDCDMLDEGVIWANWFKDQQLLLDEKRFMKEQLDIDWEYWEPDRLQQEIPSSRYHGALFESNAIHFHPLNYALGIAEVIQGKGGKVFQHSEAVDVSLDGSQKKILTPQGEILCKNIVFSGGGYMGKFFPQLSRTMLPIATYVMTTEPLGDQIEEILPSKAAVYDTRFAFDYYRRLKDTRLLWGGRISANTETPGQLEKMLRQDLSKVFPELSEVKIDYLWDGWMGYSRHQMPEIGQLSPNVWYNIAYGGHGVGPTTMGGELIAAAICNNSQDYRVFDDWDLPWNGGVFGPVAAQSQYWWLEFKDWFKDVTEKITK